MFSLLLLFSFTLSNFTTSNPQQNNLFDINSLLNLLSNVLHSEPSWYLVVQCKVNKHNTNIKIKKMDSQSM
jgi:hypothetical protein